MENLLQKVAIGEKLTNLPIGAIYRKAFQAHMQSPNSTCDQEQFHPIMS
jgi:hypothetical protein